MYEFSTLKANEKDGVGEAGLTAAGMRRFVKCYKGYGEKEKPSGVDPYREMKSGY